jgi:GNAT superfamily N-acetyltransferase
MIRMSESARIEKVEGANVHHLIHLIGQLAEFESLTPPDAEAMERLARDATTDRKLFDASIALVGDRAVGYVIYYFTYSTFLARPTLFLEDIFVTEEYRKKGVGRDLFRYCVNEARTRRCGRMEWAVLTWNKDAIDFYEKLGGKRIDWYLYRLGEKEFESK